MTNLFFYQCKSRVNQCLKYLCVLCALSGFEQKIQNEANLSKRPVLRSSPSAKKEPNFNQSTAVVAYSSEFTYLLRPGGLRNTICASSRLPAKTAYRFQSANKKCQTNPIYAFFRPKTMITKKNEPNLSHDLSIVACCQRRWNPITTQLPILSMNNEQ